jgi:hypothetical protein
MLGPAICNWRNRGIDWLGPSDYDVLFAILVDVPSLAKGYCAFGIAWVPAALFGHA